MDQDQTESARIIIENLVRQFAPWDDMFGGYSAGFLHSLERAFEFLGWDDPHVVENDACDISNCSRRATCFFGPSASRRRTCHEHNPNPPPWQRKEIKSAD